METSLINLMLNNTCNWGTQTNCTIFKILKFIPFFDEIYFISSKLTFYQNKE